MCVLYIKYIYSQLFPNQLSGKQQNVVRCDQCRRESVREQSFYDLTLDIKGQLFIYMLCCVCIYPIYVYIVEKHNVYVYTVYIYVLCVCVVYIYICT